MSTNEEIAFLKAENEKLHGETLALQWLLTCLMNSLHRSGSVKPDVIAESFDCAADITEELAIRFGKQAASEHTVGALRIVEMLRKQVFPNG